MTVPENQSTSPPGAQQPGNKVLPFSWRSLFRQSPSPLANVDPAAIAAAKALKNQVRLKVVARLVGGVVVVSIPVLVWWKWAREERAKVLHEVQTRVRIPNVQTADDWLIDKCQPGDVILFDRRCEKCAASPWAALSCYMGRYFLCSDERKVAKTAEGNFDHIGLVVPGYVRERKDLFDTSNLLLMEATPGEGIVARPLKARLEATQSRSVVLLQLACPSEKRNVEEDYEQTETVKRTRQHVERELQRFRDKWLQLSKEKGYKWIHSTVGLGGALAYGMGMHEYIRGPVSPAAYLVLTGLQQAAAAQNIRERENLAVKVEDFLRDYRWHEQDAVHLRPGWKFLQPIHLRETSRQ